MMMPARSYTIQIFCSPLSTSQRTIQLKISQIRNVTHLKKAKVLGMFHNMLGIANYAAL